jgi:catechol 2,3-dioxygenase-like lactoylglutathione lyase family enzyme
MLGDAKFQGFIPVADIARAKAFYVDVLGLSVIEENPHVANLDAAGTMLRLTLVDDHEPQQFTIAGWQVEEIAATIKVLSAKGVQFRHYDGFDQDELEIWTTPGGDQVAWFADPDNNNLSLTQFN